MMKKWMAGLLTLVLSVGLLTGCQVGDTQYVFYHKRVNNKTVFCANEEKCSLKEAKIYLCNYRNIYGGAYGMDLWTHEETAQDLEDYVKEVTLAELARVFCMDQLAKQQGFVLEEEEEKLVSEAAQVYYDSLTDAEIRYMDIRLSDVELAYEHYAMAMKLYRTLTAGVNEEVSDDEARVIRVQQIYVPDIETANTVANKLAYGEDFAAVAASYNRKPSVEVTVARGEYPEPVELVAFNLEEGAVSDMITADDGYYFIRCLSKYEEELTEQNKENILLQREKEQFDDQYEAFVNSSEFELNEELWEQISLVEMEDAGEIQTSSFFEVYEQVFTEKNE